MSFLAGRLASTEGAYFLQESKQAVTRLAQKIQKNNTTTQKTVDPIPENELSSSSSSTADVLPEILRHSLPSKIFHSPPENLSTPFSGGASKWALKTDPKKYVASADAMNPLRAYVSLPQVTFGPRRWQLPNPENSGLASTANDLRHDKYTPINPEKLKAAAAGLTQIGSAFAIATTAVFGGSALIFGLAISKLEVQNADDVRTKGKDLVQPTLETIRERLVPIRIWAEERSKKWHLERQESLKENPLLKELSRKLGAKTNP